MSDEKREERADALRRLLAEAVEQVQPAPGAQARLLARVRASGRRSRRPRLASHRLRWAAAAATSALVVVGATVIFAGRTGDGSAGTSATAGGAAGSPATSVASPPAAAPASSRATNDVAGTKSTQSQPEQGRPGSAGSASSGSVPGASSGSLPPLAPLRSQDLDGDGVADDLTIDRGTLVARLSRDGVQAVRLPSVSRGARVLGVAPLRGDSGSIVPVAFVRLQALPGSASDTAVALVDGWLTFLRLGSGPALLAVDARHGYGCDDSKLAISGNPGAYVIVGNRLVRSPRLRAVLTPVGQATGCGG